MGALTIYAHRLVALEPEAAHQELAEHEITSALAGGAGDELAADQLRMLAAELHSRMISGGDPEA